MQALAAVLEEVGGPFKIERLELAPPKAHEVLIRMGAVGVCHSDWHLVTGATLHPFPVVPGHEGAGVVEAVGSNVSAVEVGDHVALNWAPACGKCFYCLDGSPSLCAEYVDRIWEGCLLDGTPRFSRQGQPVFQFCALGCFADRTVAPEASCVKLPKQIPLDVAALIGCAVTTGVGSVLNTAGVRPGSSVAVFGAGGVGLSTILGAKLAGASPIVAVDVSESKLNEAKRFGATHGVPAGEAAVEEIRSITGGRGADYVFEAVGIPSVQESCLASARPGGTVVFSGIAPQRSTTNISGASLTRESKTVKGCYYGSSIPARDFPRFSELYLAGLLDLDALVTKRYSLPEINEAYADMLEGRLARGVVVFDGCR